MMDAGAQSPKETWLRLLLMTLGICHDRARRSRSMSTATVVANLDMGWPQIRVSVEYDGDQHRTDRDTYVKDIGTARTHTTGWAGSTSEL